jgi:CheY-like chemotaxis protein
MNQPRQPASPRVLIVDDVPEIREVLIRSLDASGMEVFEAENGTAALRAARNDVPDVVVSDIDMPLMDGLELCRRLRADPVTRRVIVVIVSGDASTQARAAVDAGCDAVLGKPCSPGLLLATIGRLLLRD